MADKVVQLVDKNSNNLYPVAGAAITDAISTGAISSQAVTSAKIANGNVTGVANNATVVGNTQLALDTVGTPNLRNQSVTSQKIDWATMNADGANNDAARIWRLDAQMPNKDRGWGPVIYNNGGDRRIIINGVTYNGTGGAPAISILGFWAGVGGLSSSQTDMWAQIGVLLSFPQQPEHSGKIVRRYRNSTYGSSGNNGENWIIVG